MYRPGRAVSDVVLIIQSTTSEWRYKTMNISAEQPEGL